MGVIVTKRKDYYLRPQTMAGMPQAGTKITGGVPIKKNGQQKGKPLV